MDENRLEKHMKDRLSRYESFTDSNALWDAIEAKQNKGNNNRWLLLMSSLLFVGVLGYAAFYFLNPNPKELSDTIELQELSIVEKTIENQEFTSIEASIVNSDSKAQKDNEAKASKTNKKTEDHEKTKDVLTKISTNDKKAAVHQNNDLASNPIQIKSNSALSSSAINNIIKQVHKDQTDPLAESLIVLSNESNTAVVSSINSNDDDISNPLRGTETFTSRPLESKNEIATSNSANDKLIKELSTLPLKLYYIEYAHHIDLPSMPIESKALATNNSYVDYDQRQKQKKSNILNGLNLGLSSSYNYPFRTLSHNGDTSLVNHVKLRSDIETSLELVRYDFLVGYKFKNNLTVHSGISWSQLTERLDLKNTIEKQIWVDTLTQILIYKDSSTSSMQGVIEGTEITRTNETYYNRFRSIDIPIQIGYQNSFQQSKWGYYGYMGALINIKFQKSGFILDPFSNELSAINEVADGNFWRTKQSVRMNVGAGLVYQINPNIQLKFGPYVEYSTKSITIPSAPIQQKYSYVGVQLHANYTF